MNDFDRQLARLGEPDVTEPLDCDWVLMIWTHAAVGAAGLVLGLVIGYLMA